MTLKINMKIDGIEGDSKSYSHKGWSDVISWNWGMTSNRKSSQLIDGDKTSLNELSIIKYIGKDSSSIRSLFAMGTVIPKIDISILPVVGKREVQTKYVDIYLEGVVIKSIVTGGNIEDAHFKEHITLLFDKVKFSYSQDSVSDSDVEGKPAAVDFSWNVMESAEWRT